MIEIQDGDSITEAIADAIPGETIAAADGAYTGFRLTKPGITVLATPGASFSGHVWVDRQAEHATLDGGTYRFGNAESRTNPTVDAVDFTLRNAVVDNERRSIALHLGGNATDRSAARARVHHNRFVNVGRRPWTNYDHGVYLKWAPEAWIHDNEFEGGGDYAIHFWAGASPDVVVEHNLIRGGWAGAVIFGGNTAGGSDGGAFRRNVVYGPPRPGRTMVYEYTSGWSGRKVEVTENLFVGVGPFLLAGPSTYTALSNLTVSEAEAAMLEGYGPRPVDSTPPPPGPDHRITPDLREALLATVAVRMGQQRGRANALAARFDERGEPGYAARAREVGGNATVCQDEVTALLEGAGSP